MIYWSERVKDFDNYVLEEIKRASDEGKEITMPLSKGWIFKSYDEFKADTMLSESTKTISRHISKLVDLGFLDRRRNPNYNYDRKYQYRVNLLKIKEALNNEGYELQGYKFNLDNLNLSNGKVKSSTSICQNDSSKSQYDKSERQIDKSKRHIVQTIPEITTDITIENTLETTSSTKEKNTFSNDDDEKNSLKKFNSKINNIAKSFSEIIDKPVNINDLNTIEEVLKYDIDLSVKEKETIIFDTISATYTKIRSIDPNKKINSFKYFYQSIIDEFEKHIKFKNDSKMISDENSKNKKDIHDFFEYAWSKYPKQEGKEDISILQKLQIHSLGDEFIRAIERYLKYDMDLKINSGWKELQQGKTFFNKGYKEWLDKNFEEKKLNPIKSESELKKERIFKLMRENKEAGLL
jgi:DNA-binding MarR family transcriptional regulator